MSKIIETVEVDVPVRTAYNQWTQFETFPAFMDAVEKVRQVDDQTIEWHAKVGGVDKVWTARITQQEPDQRIAWTSIEGARNAGVVTFHRLAESATRVTLQLDVEPEGPLETAGDLAGVVRNTIKGDLERFKAFIERQGDETGAWRGTVEQTAGR